MQQCQRAIVALEELQRRLLLPRTRYRQRADVENAVRELLEKRNVDSLLQVEITEIEQETYRQLKRGRPTKTTKYRRDVTTRYKLGWKMNEERWREAQAEDGVFPLLTNERGQTAREVLEAYKRQPTIEKRFSQFKSDYDVAPVFLKNPKRILGLFTVYFLAMLVQALIERELRRALERERKAAKDKRSAGRIELYPEGRSTRRPTTRRVIDALEPLRRYEIHTEPGEPPLFFDELSPTQKRLVSLLGLDPKKYGR
jgi:transposase